MAAWHGINDKCLCSYGVWRPLTELYITGSGVLFHQGMMSWDTVWCNEREAPLLQRERATRLLVEILWTFAHIHTYETSVDHETFRLPPLMSKNTNTTTTMEAASRFSCTAHCLAQRVLLDFRPIYWCVPAQATGQHAWSHSDSRLDSSFQFHGCKW